jgi:hypothetical protein
MSQPCRVRPKPSDRRGKPHDSARVTTAAPQSQTLNRHTGIKQSGANRPQIGERNNKTVKVVRVIHADQLLQHGVGNTDFKISKRWRTRIIPAVGRRSGWNLQVVTPMSTVRKPHALMQLSWRRSICSEGALFLQAGRKAG